MKRRCWIAIKGWLLTRLLETKRYVYNFIDWKRVDFKKEE